MAGIAGTVLVSLLRQLLASLIPGCGGRIFVIASVLGRRPAAILVSLIIGARGPGGKGVPVGALEDTRHARLPPPWNAIVKGTTRQVLKLLLNIIAMLIVLVALVYLANAMLGLLPRYRRCPGSRCKRMLGLCHGAGVPG